MADIFEERSKLTLKAPSKKKSLPLEASSYIEPQEEERGLLASLQRGLKSGVSGLFMGYRPQPTPKDETWVEHLGALGGQVASSLPAYPVGAAAGSAIGGPIGGAAGAFALPAAIENAFKEYYDFTDKGGDATFGEFLEGMGRIAKETGKAGIVGGVTGQIGKLLPILSKIPGAEKILNTRAGRGITTGALEVGTMAGTHAALEGRVPTQQELLDNAIIALGMKAGHLAGKKVSDVGRSIIRKDNIAEGVTSLFPENIQEKGKELGKKILEKTPEDIKAVGREWSKIKLNENKKDFFDMVKTHYNERNAKFVESQFNWREALETAQKTEKFTKPQLEEMMYYRQKTGNPNLKGDTYKELSNRLPQHAKEFVDKVVGPHLEDSLAMWNENELTKNIEPRRALQDIYLPGLYEFDRTKLPRAYDEVSRQFKTKNPFSNRKKFLSYMDAFKAKGLKPRYTNIVDLMKAYDRITIKTMANIEFLDRLKKLEKSSKQRLIVKSTERKLYDKAKEEGWVPFDDVFLRQYVAGIKKPKNPYTEHLRKNVMEPGSERVGRPFFDEFMRGPVKDIYQQAEKPIRATTAAPALVHPDLAPALQGVFRKDAYKPSSDTWRLLDNARDVIRTGRVMLSPFHYASLLVGSLGTGGNRVLTMRKWTREANVLRRDKEFMMDAAKSGLTVHEPVEEKSYEKSQRLIDKAADYLSAGGKRKGVDKALNVFVKGSNYLFDEFQPNLKVVTWKDLVNKQIGKYTKDGVMPTEAEVAEIKKVSAETVNNLFGGLSWETMRFFNNPKTMTFLKRTIGYPDWTMSTGRMAMNAFSSGLKGQISRSYWTKHLASLLALHGALKFISSGLEQTDEKDKKASGIKWNPNKALNGVFGGDPSAWHKFPLPDIDIKVGGKTFNPGRDSEGHKLYSHFGKQSYEAARWITSPLDELFIKSNPLIQIFWKQAFERDPAGFVTRGKYKYGRELPWDATEPLTVDRFVSRAKELTGELVPFGLKSGFEKGVAPYAATLLGAIPVAQGMTLYKSVPFIEEALKTKDKAKLNRIIKALRDNKVAEKQIKKQISIIKNGLKSPKKT